ncbi:hypothetical protein P280DRAFT_114110 [Massarina eburnea CBS 473.64]|uniref:AA1-like domain-containing protein n=1 Tax=Massarina eburnea CBS 473.64 TaxID=1395130 RepID=A0A6A6RPX5_9PLEO|nr:hypothetical protein P280DRAFT_114110 [Massarina eburnea CBS 473.64]
MRLFPLLMAFMGLIGLAASAPGLDAVLRDDVSVLSRGWTSTYTYGHGSTTQTPTSVPSPVHTVPEVTISFYTDEVCKSLNSGIDFYDDHCQNLTTFNGLKIRLADPVLPYNSLRLFETDNCTGPWTLEPITCVRNGRCPCSGIKGYHSIKVVYSE